MRIIGGAYKRKTILSVPGTDTRPTSDRLRESLFNILSATVCGTCVLDLYAGTGALGLEALSRGARQCVFVDNRKKALEVIRKNLASCAIDDRARVIFWDISQNLTCLRQQNPPFDLVFMDPPYGKNLVPHTLMALITSGCLSHGAQIVCEHDTKDEIPFVPDHMTLTDQRFYGRTGVSFFTFLPDCDSGA